MEVLDTIVATQIRGRTDTYYGDLISISATDLHVHDVIEVETMTDHTDAISVSGVSLLSGDKVTIILDADEPVDILGA